MVGACSMYGGKRGVYRFLVGKLERGCLEDLQLDGG
jgi:hypothetical protein